MGLGRTEFPATLPRLDVAGPPIAIAGRRLRSFQAEQTSASITETLDPWPPCRRAGRRNGNSAGRANPGEDAGCSVSWRYRMEEQSEGEGTT